MPKVDKKADIEEIEEEEESSTMLATRTATKRATSYSQRSISSMFTKTGGGKGKGKGKGSAASATTEKVEASTEVEVETVASSSAKEDAEPVASTSTSQIEIPIKVVLDTLEKDTMHGTWYNALKSEFSKPYFESLKKFLASEHAAHTVFPAMENIYSWSRYTPLPNVKVVILGQDPYHDVNQAHGLSFSVLPPTKPPASLRNIYKQLAEDFPGFVPPKDKGDLSAVASQGVLWLNTCLTVRAHKAGSHSKKGWETFTTQVLKAVLHRKLGAEDGEQREGVVFMAWGLPAQNNLAKLGIDKKKHLLLQSAHPSPLSANRGFHGNGHFRKANEWLVEKYGEDAAIDWTVLSAPKK
ncbi:hypothetical protein H1R20_g8130, partial [Candolleomyces eurysporus]